MLWHGAASAEIARMAALLNKTIENIGARRLHTVVERIVEEVRARHAEKRLLLTAHF